MMTELEYVQALRAACNKIVYARESDVDTLRIAITDALLQFLAAHERYTGANVGAARILKPLLMMAMCEATEADFDFVRSLSRAVEKRHNLPSSRRERGLRYAARGGGE
jgi:hypothetical protein